MLQAIGVKHAFTTRIGGVSPAPFDSLNFGNPAGNVRDPDANLNANVGKLEEAVRLPDRRRVWVHQVHGNGVRIARDASFENGCQGDAIISDDATAYLMVRVADCVPILLVTPDGTAVAAIHAGWRGAVAQVVPEAVRALAMFAEISATQIIAAIGPCIARDAFEVGPEVVAEFIGRFGESPSWANRHVDLPEAVATQLRTSGIPTSQIDRTDRCTSRDRDEFFSHRRDHGITGRMAAVIAAVER
jgi:YfiH family protein